MSFLKDKGPSIPVKVSGHLGVDTMLASAFLAELLSDKEIKMSKMKVGNSPIYFLNGQEERLQDFSNYLKGREREAFELLKDKKILRDRNQEPAIRVALRSIKDFAFPFKVRDETFWRFYLVNHHEAVGNVEDNIPEPKVTVMSKIKEAFIGEEVKPVEGVEKGVEENVNVVGEEVEKGVETSVKVVEPMKEVVRENSEDVSKEVVGESVGEVVKEIPKEIVKVVSFGSRAESFLGENGFQIVRKIQARKRDYSAVVRIRNDSEIKDYLCISKDKKSVTEGDVLKFLEEGKMDKLPVLILSTGEPNKKAQEWLEYLKGVVSFMKLG
jgi:hypothetical protein